LVVYSPTGERIEEREREREREGKRKEKKRKRERRGGAEERAVHTIIPI